MVPDPRNQNLNAAYWPTGQTPNVAPSVMVPQGNTQFNPLAGTGWGQALDAMGASDPGGMAMKGLLGAASPTALAQSNLPPGTLQGPAPGTIPTPGSLIKPSSNKGKAKAPTPGPQTGAMGGLRSAADQFYANKYPGAGTTTTIGNS